MELNFNLNFEHLKVKMILLHNGVELPETEMYSYSDVHAHDMASRSTVSNFEEFAQNIFSVKSLSHLLLNKVHTKYILRKKFNLPPSK